MRHYYYSESEQQLGPFTIDELKTKRLKKSTLVWTDGMPDWSTADTMNELKEILISEPPPLPKKKVSETKQTISSNHSFPKESNSKYDNTYKKETDATSAGIILIIANIGLIIYYNFLKAQIHDAYSYEEYSISTETVRIISLISLALRIGVTVWITQIAERQNRNQTQWGFLGFFFPSISLIVIGQKRKLKFQIEVNQLHTKIEQYKKLKEQAESLSNNNRYNEAGQIYKYIYENYSTTNSDIFRLAELLFLTKEYKDAEVHFKKIKDDTDYSSVSNYYLGFIAVKKNDLSTAKTLLILAAEKGEIFSQILLNTILQNSIDSSAIEQMKVKYGLGNSISTLGELEIIEGLEIFDLSISKKFKGSIHLYWNGIRLIFWEQTWKRKEQSFFINFHLLKGIERTEGIQFKLQLKDKQHILFAASSLGIDKITPEKVQEFETAYNIAVEDFQN